MKQQLTIDQQKNMTVSYLCGVTWEKLLEKYDVNSLVRQHLLENSKALNDPLIEYYRTQNRTANALHMYLTFEQHRTNDNSTGTGLYKHLKFRNNDETPSIDLCLYSPAHYLVDKNIFEPLLYQTMRATGLSYTAFALHDPKSKSWEPHTQRLIYQAEDMTRPVVLPHLEKAYDHAKLLQPSNQVTHGVIESAYNLAALDISRQVLQGMQALKRPSVQKALEEDKKMFEADLREAIKVLTEREKEVIEERFGLGTGHAKTLEEVGKQFRVTRERIRQIEAKALRKMRFSQRNQD